MHQAVLRNLHLVFSFIFTAILYYRGYYSYFVIDRIEKTNVSRCTWFIEVYMLGEWQDSNLGGLTQGYSELLCMSNAMLPGYL